MSAFHRTRAGHVFAVETGHYPGVNQSICWVSVSNVVPQLRCRAHGLRVLLGDPVQSTVSMQAGQPFGCSKGSYHGRELSYRVA